LIDTIHSIRFIGGRGLGALTAFTGLTSTGLTKVGRRVGRAGAASATKFLVGVSAEGLSFRGPCTFEVDFGVILSLIVVGRVVGGVRGAGSATGVLVGCFVAFEAFKG